MDAPNGMLGGSTVSTRVTKNPTSDIGGIAAATAAPSVSGIRDNYKRGLVADFLRNKIKDGSKLSVVSAYFTIYAFDALKDWLLEDAPLGLYAVVPPDPKYQVIAPGVIYCLRQRDAGGGETVNPLQPHYLVYVRVDGPVRFGFAQPKQILEILRLVCSGKTVPYEELCNIFDRDSKDGADMREYSALLQKAVDSIVATFRRRVAAGLQSGREFVIPNRSERQTTTAILNW